MTTTTPVPAAAEPADRVPPDLDARRGTATREATVFVAITFVVAIGIALLFPGTKENPGPAALLTLLVPATVVGLIRLSARMRRAPANPFPLGLRHLGLRSWPAAVLLPVVAVGSSLAIAAALGVVYFDGLAGYVVSAPINIAVMTLLLLGEEIGWRGYLLPRVAALLPVRKASLVTGLIHACYHLPLLLLTVAYDSDGSRWIVVPGVIVVITAGGAVFGWLRIRSGSLWPAMIAHATVNTCFVGAPQLLSHDADLAAYVTGEGGILTVITVVLVAALVLRFANWSPRDAEPAAPTV